MEEVMADTTVKRKNKLLAMVLAFLFIGLGVFYLGVKRGLTMTMASIIVIVVFHQLPESLRFMGIAINVGCAYYAFREVDVINGAANAA